MSVSAETLRLLMEAGLEGERLLAIVESIDRNGEKPLSAGAIRTRRYRQRIAERSEGVTSDVTVTRHGDERKGSKPPKENYLSPPLKGGISPQTEAQPPAKPLAAEREKSLSVWVSEIWEITPRPSRERSGKRDLENSLRAAQRRGADLAAVKAGLVGYFASEDATKSGGQFCKGVHTLVSSGRWEAFSADAGPDPPPEPVDPWRQRLLGWEVNGYWNSEWGPKPGKPGCLAPQPQSEAA